MLSTTFQDWGGGADDPDLSVALTRSTATFHTPEILHIIRRNCYTSQGDPDSSFPLWCMGKGNVLCALKPVLLLKEVGNARLGESSWPNSEKMLIMLQHHLLGPGFHK